MAATESDPDHLLFSLLHLGKVAWAARKREMKRGPSWMLDQQIAKFVKEVLLIKDIAEASMPLYMVDLMKYENEPDFHSVVCDHFRATFGLPIQDALANGSVRVHEW